MKLYERFESGELTKMTEEIVEEIVRNCVDKGDWTSYFCYVHPETAAKELASEGWDGYDIEYVAREYARWKTVKWADETLKIKAEDLAWHEDSTIDDIAFELSMKIWDIEKERRRDWLREFRNSTQLPEDHPDHIDISDCSTK